MSIILISIVIFVVTLGAALVGLAVHKWLPSEQKNDSARSIVSQVGGSSAFSWRWSWAR